MAMPMPGFCPFIIGIGVQPCSLLYNAAVAAAATIKDILTEASFLKIELAFVESVVTRNTSPKLLSFNTFTNSVPDLCKPFTPHSRSLYHVSQVPTL